MKRVGIIAALSMLVVALSASPALADVAPGTYFPGFNDANAPNGTHVQSGTPSCTVNADLSVDCSAYELAGVGHTNADADLVANYTAIVDCYNPGNNPNNPIESHTTDFQADDSAEVSSRKNGRMNVPALDADPASVGQVCPNPNWRPQIQEGTLELVSFTYTLTFEDFEHPYITISEP